MSASARKKIVEMHEEITKQREQVEYHKAYAEEAMSEFNWLMETKKAQAAVIEKLREALSNCIVEHPDKPFVHLAAWRVKEALALSTDSTQILAAVRRAEREKCADVCEKSDRYRGDYFASKIRALE